MTTTPQQTVMIVGVPKAGTTTIYDALVNHKEISLPSVKEPCFFNEDDNYKWGLDYYFDKYYGGITPGSIPVDCTTLYSGSRKAAERIFNTMGPKTKIIIVLRNPIDRAYSHYLHNKKDEIYNKNKSFEHVVDVATEGLEYSDCLWYSMYYTIIKIWEEKFGRKNILLLSFENDIAGNLQQGIDKICDFIGVSRIHLEKNIESNAAKTSRKGFAAIRKAVFSESPVKNIIKRIVPPYYRQKFRLLFDNLTAKKITNRVGVNNETRIYLYNKYLREEMEALKREYGVDYTIKDI